MHIRNYNTRPVSECSAQSPGASMPVACSLSAAPEPDIAISIKNVGKKYRLYDSPKHRLKEALHPFRKKFHRDFWALKNISFEVKKGDTVGIIGRNGAGKSTLLQIITGTLTPSQGTVEVNGRISALLELGAGFNPEFTGRQNVYMNGALLGFAEKETNERFEAICKFADIGDFIDQPVKTYSSGMYVRLAFATAINVEPDILVVDEALSVGDMFFQAKCMSKLKDMIDKGATLIFVSHDVGSVKSLCQRAFLLKDGGIIANGEAAVVVEEYFAMRIAGEQAVVKGSNVKKRRPEVEMDDRQKSDLKLASFRNNEEFIRRAAFQRIRNGKADFINVQLLDKAGREIQSVEYGQDVVLRMSLEIYEDIHMLSCGYHIQNKNGVSIVNSNLNIEDKKIMYTKKGDRYCVDWGFKVSLMEGIYNILCVMSIPLNAEFGEVDFCDYVPCALQFQMQRMARSRLYGHVHWDNVVEITTL